MLVYVEPGLGPAFDRPWHASIEPERRKDLLAGALRSIHIINEFVIILTERPEPDRREPEGGDPDRGEPIISIAYLNDASPVRNTRVERSDHAIGADRS
jgi:hypothetical protein